MRESVNNSLCPSTVVIEPTNKCNLKCDFCEANCSINRLQPRHDLSPEHLQLILEKIRPFIINVVFQGDCEPTMSPHLPDLVRIASKFSTSIAVVTNGTLLSSDYAHKLIQNGTNWFTFSIDDHRAEAFDKIRVGASLDKILEHLDTLIDMRDTAYLGIHVGIHKIVMPYDTIETLKEFVRVFYIQRRVNHITISPLVKMGDIKVKNFLRFRNELECSLMDDGIFLNLREFNSFPYRTLYKYCGTNLLFIDREGNLSPCGLHVQRCRSFGNLLDQSLDEITQGKAHREYHQFWETKDYSMPLPSVCDDCFVLKADYHRYTLNEGHFQGLQFSNRPFEK
jgi:radical SAM protein with 4Fe4S-binding SPASM domain